MATIEKKGSGRWRARIRRTGQPELSRTFTSKTQAKLWARHTEADLDRGLAAGNGPAETPVPVAAAQAAAPLRGPSDDTTLGELIALYRDAVTPDHRGAESECIRINRWLRDVRDGGHPLRDHVLSAITRQQVQAWMTTRLKTVKPDTIRREVTLLQQIVSHAIRDWGYEDLAANPFQQARKPKAGRGRVRRLAKDEEHYLQRALDPEASLPAGIRPARSDDLLFLFTFAIETTMRRSELLRVRWENVDLESCVVDLPDSDTKNGERRSVALSERAVEVLLRFGRKRSGPVFGITTSALACAWKRAMKRAMKRARRIYEAECHAKGTEPDPTVLKDLRWHDLRHEGTSRLFELGFEFTEVATVTGHKDVRMLMRYTHHRAANLAARMRNPEKHQT